MIFCHGIKSEIKKVRWTNKKDMLKYSIASIVFIIFCVMCKELCINKRKLNNE